MIATQTEPLKGSERYPGPYVLEQIHVIDGDTLRGITRVFPGMIADTNIRIDGIDTAELRGSCPKEKALANQARELVIALVEGRQVVIRDVELGAFAGRMRARVEVDGENLAEILATPAEAGANFVLSFSLCGSLTSRA